MRERKRRSGVNWQGALKEKGVIQTGVIKELGILLIKSCLNLKTSTTSIDESVIN
jgi:hypothetical protein